MGGVSLQTVCVSYASIILHSSVGTASFVKLLRNQQFNLQHNSISQDKFDLLELSEPTIEIQDHFEDPLHLQIRLPKFFLTIDSDFFVEEPTLQVEDMF